MGVFISLAHAKSGEKKDHRPFLAGDHEKRARLFRKARLIRSSCVSAWEREKADNGDPTQRSSERDGGFNGWLNTYARKGVALSAGVSPVPHAFAKAPRPGPHQRCDRAGLLPAMVGANRQESFRER